MCTVYNEEHQYDPHPSGHGHGPLIMAGTVAIIVASVVLAV